VDRSKRWIAAAVVAVAALGTGTGIAVASNGGDDSATEQPITGPALARASKAALAETGGGSVTSTEINDEEGYYQVEVKIADGSHVDVNLDQSFHVIKTKADSDNVQSGNQN